MLKSLTALALAFASLFALASLCGGCGKATPKTSIGDYCTLQGFDSNAGGYKYLCSYPNSGTPPVHSLVWTDENTKPITSQCYTLDNATCAPVTAPSH